MRSPLGGHGPTATRCDAALRTVFATLPDDCSPTERDRRISRAYPFRSRQGWEYKVWLARVKAWKIDHATHGPLTTQLPPEGRVARQRRGAKEFQERRDRRSDRTWGVVHVDGQGRTVDRPVPLDRHTLDLFDPPAAAPGPALPPGAGPAPKDEERREQGR